MNKRDPWYKYIKDFIIYFGIIAILILVALIYFDEVSSDNILELVTQYVGSVVTILLGVIGIIEFSYDNGLTILTPHSFINYKEKKLQEQTKRYLNEFFHYEAEYFSQHSNSRITYLLNQLGLNRNEFDQLKMEILSIKLLPMHNLEDARDKLYRVIKTGNIILSQDGMNSDELVYKQVKYFINFTDVMFIDDYYNQITDCLVYLIKEITREKKIKFNRVIISHSGNFLLGMGVSQKTNARLIKVTERPLILHSKCWIGDFSANEKDNSILVHDVLVSGKQLKESINRVNKNTHISGIFCLINRLDSKSLEEFQQELGIPVYYLLSLDDKDIERIEHEKL